MTREREIEILMKDSCTRKEAERFLDRYTEIFKASDFENNLESYLDDWGIDEDDREDYRRMVSDGDAVTDWSIVELDGEKYYISYVN